jgi:hypothetical protein
MFGETFGRNIGKREGYFRIWGKFREAKISGVAATDRSRGFIPYREGWQRSQIGKALWEQQKVFLSDRTFVPRKNPRFLKVYLAHTRFKTVNFGSCVLGHGKNPCQNRRFRPTPKSSSLCTHSFYSSDSTKVEDPETPLRSARTSPLRSRG